MEEVKGQNKVSNGSVKADELPLLLDVRPEVSATEQIKWYNNVIAFLIIFHLVLALSIIIMFRYNQPPLNFSLPLDRYLFSAFGNVCSGILGTFAALCGTILVVSTLKKQIEYNEKAQKTNEKLLKATEASNDLYQKQQKQHDIQIFDSQFRSFFDLYKSAIDDFASRKGDSNNGREVLKDIVKELNSIATVKDTTYDKRVNDAAEDYERIYAFHSDKMSTHFRMLYQLMRFISNAKYIEEDTRVDYANAVQGNLSESEMILLRYNCFCSFGEEMQQYVNEFDLLKHLPIMKLIEFKKWGSLINDEDCAHAIEAIFISTRKALSEVVTNDSDKDIRKKDIKCGNKWIIAISYKRSTNSLRVQIINIKKFNNEGDSKTQIEKAFNKLGIERMEKLFCDFFDELFLKSNFDFYNQNMNRSHRIISSKEGNPKIYFWFQSTYPLIISQQRILPPQFTK